MNKQYLILILVTTLLISISVYNYMTYFKIKKAENKYKDKALFERNCNINKLHVQVGEISNILTFSLSIVLLIMLFSIKNKYL